MPPSQASPRLFSAPDESWPRWVWATLGESSIDSSGQLSTLCGGHWQGLLQLLPLYRDISRVTIADGQRTAFWLDNWLPCGALSSCMPELFSHSMAPTVSVQKLLRAGLDVNLAPRLSATASAQRRALLATLAQVRLNDAADQRSLPLCAANDGRLRTSSLYALCMLGGELSDNYNFVWQNFAPSKVKFFAWLLVQGRIQCRANLLHKKIIEAADSGCAICGADAENTDHIVFSCPFARTFWEAIGSPRVHAADEGARSCPLPPAAPETTASTLRLLCLWHPWKHRNGVVFNRNSPSLSSLLKNCRDDAVLWRARLPTERRPDVDVCLNILSPTMSSLYFV
ncbi:unnamed protein product [Alopecurus aequalis]